MVIVRRTLAVLVVVAAVALWWLGSSVPVPATSSFWLAQPGALDELRRTATGTGPFEVRVGVVGQTETPAWISTAWGGFAAETRVFVTLQLVYPDGHVVIDAPFGAATQREVLGDEAPFDAEQFARMQAALATAQTILISHVHRDHLGGLVDAPDPRALLARTAVTPEQRSGLRRKGDIENGDAATLAFDVESFDDLKRILDFERLAQVAPGVVAIETPGHTPGHLLFYVRTADGRELLYAGDLAWSFRNLQTARTRPRLVSEYFLHEDAAAVADQLRALITFAELNPEVEVFVAHDADRIERLVDLGVLEEGLK
ncbi:MAG: MBL fold metallo-hydrolase [Deltaproteobacteria bacterium]|nr:MBL fold metallo-hydrolase [Deltaproteobacteria bacterium]